MPRQLTEIVDTLRGYREGLGNLGADVEAIVEPVTDWGAHPGDASTGNP